MATKPATPSPRERNDGAGQRAYPVSSIGKRCERPCRTWSAGKPPRPSSASAGHARRFRLRKSHQVRFLQVEAIRLSETVALGLTQPGVVVTSGVTGYPGFPMKTEDAAITQRRIMWNLGSCQAARMFLGLPRLPWSYGPQFRHRIAFSVGNPDLAAVHGDRIRIVEAVAGHRTGSAPGCCRLCSALSRRCPRWQSKRGCRLRRRIRRIEVAASGVHAASRRLVAGFDEGQVGEVQACPGHSVGKAERGRCPYLRCSPQPGFTVRRGLSPSRCGGGTARAGGVRAPSSPAWRDERQQGHR